MTHPFRLFRRLLAASLLTAATAVPLAHADVSFATGGYSRALHTMAMMRKVDANGDHMVSKEEFMNYFGALFDELDRDHDGTVDAREWVGASSHHEISVATGGYSRELRRMPMMKAMDEDQDHKVTREEFLKFHEAMFTSMDEKNTGVITAETWLRKVTRN